MKFHFVIGLLFLTSVVSAQPTSDQDVVPLDPAVRYGKLENGFTYYIRNNDLPGPELELKLVVKAGFVNQDADQIELAHLLEHMAFNGTKKYPGTQLPAYLKKNGIAARAQTFDRSTRYALTLNDPTPELVDNSLAIIREWCQNLTLDSLEVEKERGVIVAEYTKSAFESTKSNEELIHRLVNHPMYPKSPSQAKVQSIKSFKQGSLRRFFIDWYRPDLQAIVVVGNVDLDETERKICRVFADLAMPVNPRRSVDDKDITNKYSVALAGKNRLFTFPTETGANASIELILKKRATLVAVRTIGDLKESAKDRVFNEMMRARLKKVTERYNTPINSVSCNFSRNTIHSLARIDALRVEVSVNDHEMLGAAFKSIVNELTLIQKFGFSHHDLIRTKATLAQRGRVRPNLSVSQIANKYVDHFCGELAAGLDDKADLVSKTIEQLSLADINKLAADRIDFSKDRDIVVKTPHGTRAPTKGNFEEWIKEIKNATRKDTPVTRREVTRLLDDTTQLNNDSSYLITEINDIGAYKVELRNGTRVIFKPFHPTGMESDRILVHGYKSGGWSLYHAKERAAARYAGSIVGNAGAGDFDKFQLQEYLSPKGISANVAIHDSLSEISGYCPKSDVEVLLQYVYLKLTRPRLDEEAFRDWKTRSFNQQLIASVDHNGGFIEFIAQRSFYNNKIELDPGQPGIDDIAPSMVLDIYKDRFVESGGWTFVVTGDFDTPKLASLFSKYFGSLPTSAASPGRIVDARQTKRDLRRDSQVFYAGANEKAMVNIYFPNHFKPTLAAKLELELLGNVLGDRVQERLREKESATYSTRASVFFPGKADSTYAFNIFFQCETDDTEYLIDAAREEFRKIKQEGIDLESYRSALGQTRKNVLNNLSRNRFWLDYLSDKLVTNGDMTEVLKRETILTKILTIESVNKSIDKYLCDNNVQSFVWLPLNKKPK